MHHIDGTGWKYCRIICWAFWHPWDIAGINNISNLPFSCLKCYNMKYHWIVDITEFNIQRQTLYMPQIFFSCNVHFIMSQMCTVWQSKRTAVGITAVWGISFDFSCIIFWSFWSQCLDIFEIEFHHIHTQGSKSHLGIWSWILLSPSWTHSIDFCFKRHDNSFQGVQHKQLLQNLTWENIK